MAATAADTSPYRRRLREKRDYLVETMNVSNYLDALFGDFVISKADMETMRNEGNRVNQARYLLDILHGKSDDAIKRFIEITKTKQNNIYWELFPERVHSDEVLERDGLKHVTGGEAHDEGC
jgi:hypothetical protein